MNVLLKLQKLHTTVEEERAIKTETYVSTLTGLLYVHTIYNVRKVVVVERANPS